MEPIKGRQLSGLICSLQPKRSQSNGLTEVHRSFAIGSDLERASDALGSQGGTTAESCGWVPYMAFVRCNGAGVDVVLRDPLGIRPTLPPPSLASCSPWLASMRAPGSGLSTL